ncbi:MAG: 4-hydroxy-tetrahydrodipicolinate reductase [Pseudomonadota bacterium]|nr:4-hydroxy-tetrahydrodipicolinate reductase [Pseudomonadota bacterium]
MIRVGVHGATGRMGRLVLPEIEAAPDLELAWACGRELPSPLDADVIIDFSTPDGLRRLLAQAPCPVVTGTTGMTPAELLAANPALAVLHSANFSLGVAVLARLVRDAAQALPGYDIEVVELHHKHKRDAPSGTALHLVEGLGTVVSGRTGPRGDGEIGVHAVRGGDIVGEHRVYLSGPGERLELAHVATHRGLFASGAVAAARWLVGKPAGLYRIEDVIGGIGG